MTQRPKQTHLHAVHFVFADDLNRDLASLTRGVTSAVDVAEGAIAHLGDELPSLEAWVSWELALARVFLGDDLGEVGVIDTLGFCGLAMALDWSFRIRVGLSGSVVAFRRAMVVDGLGSLLRSGLILS